MFLDNLPPDLALRDEISNIRRVLNVTSDLNSNSAELFLTLSVFSEGTEKTGFRYFWNLGQEKSWSKWPHVHNVMFFLTKNRTADRFVISDAHVSQVVWPVNRVCKICDLSAHTRKVIWPPVSFTQPWDSARDNICHLYVRYYYYHL
jgi:hypothetical protein